MHREQETSNEETTMQVARVLHRGVITAGYTSSCTVMILVDRPMPSDRCLSYLPVCLSVGNVGVLWPNGLIDQDAT